MTALALLREETRTLRDRLEVLTALVGGPEFDAVLRGSVLKIPPNHPVYPWNCTVPDCERPRWRRYAMCSAHAIQRQEAEGRGVSRTQFLREAEPLPHTDVPEEMMCRICPQRPAFSLELALCLRHRNRWLSHLKRDPCPGEGSSSGGWLASHLSRATGSAARMCVTSWPRRRWGCAAPTSAATSGPGARAGPGYRRTSSPPTSGTLAPSP